MSATVGLRRDLSRQYTRWAVIFQQVSNFCEQLYLWCRPRSGQWRLLRVGHNAPRKFDLRSRQTIPNMAITFATSFGSLAVVLLLGVTASAQSTPEETKKLLSNVSERHVSNYGNHDSTCIRWTDKCRTCNRGISADIVCSNIGIACQPADVECLERQQSDDKK